MERIAMSQEERDELDWLKRAKDGEHHAAGRRLRGLVSVSAGCESC